MLQMNSTVLTSVNRIRLFTKRTFTAAAASIPIVEIRQDKLYPHLIGPYVTHCKSTPLRFVDPHLRLHCLADTGGVVNQTMEIYAYPGGMGEREENIRKGSSWLRTLQRKDCVMEQTSNIFAEAPLVKSTEGVRGILEGYPIEQDNQLSLSAIYEIRTYNLKLGYDTVPKFLSLYGAGLPSKLSAEGTDPTTSLVTLLYTEVGQLNQVIEVWRHGDGVNAMEKSRVAARSAPEWRNAIQDIAQLALKFSSTIYRPLVSF